MARAVKIRAAITTALATASLGLTGFLVGTRVNLLPVDASTNAPTYDSLFKVLFSIGTMLFLGISIVLIYSLVRFRRNEGELADGPPLEGNLPLEIVWTAIPAVVILFVGIYSYDIYDRMGGMTPLDHGALHHQHAMDTPSHTMEAKSMEMPSERVWGGIGPAIDTGVASTSSASGAVLPVEVTAMQFAFIFHYPDSNITTGELHVPVGQPVALQMKALDVIHAFWVPQFRLKQDVIPGQPTLLSFTPTRAGSYPIVCAELCGPYHGGMRSTVIVEEPDSFAAWVAKNSPNASVDTPVAVQS